MTGRLHHTRQNRSNIFRPWGFQIGHFSVWATLLLTLERLIGEPMGEDSWMLRRARELFDAATRSGWDSEHGGLVCGVAPQGHPATDPVLTVCDGDKYHWVQAASLAAAAALAQRTGDPAYDIWYEREAARDKRGAVSEINEPAV
jgi:mannose/cellobiose epimerase-like protein (N-acyl-D-glucosamine 2-epimerase family)